MTMICVTHEMGFARRMADRIVFMDHGEIVEYGTPDQMFDSPPHRSAGNILESGSLITPATPTESLPDCRFGHMLTSIIEGSKHESS